MSIGGSACHRPIDVDKTVSPRRLDPATVVPALGASALALVKVEVMDYFGHLVPHLIHAETQFLRQS